MDKHFRLRALALAVGSALILAACGGSGSTASTLSGNAAEGLAIANATLTARDAVGNTSSTTTDASGNYSLDTAGLRFPLMLQITGSKGVWHALVSADDAGRSANVNNATDRTWFTGCYLRGDCWYGMRRTVVATATYRF